MSAATVSVQNHDGVLRVSVDGDGPAAAADPVDLVDLQDRVGALGGRLSIEHRPGGQLTMCAEIPCGS
jgi:signal transduction histidine kinase